ncbi:MAG: S-methyl-5'-thioadenosine phosphorylase [Alphaproteobacteria bacterium]|nr:S-methyl-5'-thioadenosine phosphorylase [Alphaproteobacteria bacterium]MCB9796799.1 S-methyl-5'-thioadenosine phosphorylase [Alphaproteobacteria bacterium]
MRIGVMGGSGLYEIEGMKNVREERISTPFGDPSDAYIIGELDGIEMVFLPRHGRGHVLNPSEVPYRANIWGMKKLGVGWIVSVSAVGSLQEEIVPGHMVVIDQFIDRTKGVRPVTFFEKGCVGHVSFGDPVCMTLRSYLLEAAQEAGATVHDGGTYVCMEGPVFSTRAESNLYRSWGAKVIGMTNLTEAKLAREAEISYATLAMSTDYDCWHDGHDDVTVEAVIAVIKANVATAKAVIKAVAPKIAAHDGPQPVAGCMQYAIMTRPDLIPQETRDALDIIIGKYLD